LGAEGLRGPLRPLPLQLTRSSPERLLPATVATGGGGARYAPALPLAPAMLAALGLAALGLALALGLAASCALPACCLAAAAPLLPCSMMRLMMRSSSTSLSLMSRLHSCLQGRGGSRVSAGPVCI
jgi:hypothetical protein